MSNEQEEHFRAKHFLCEEERCMAEKFVAFETLQELNYHRVWMRPWRTCCPVQSCI